MAIRVRPNAHFDIPKIRVDEAIAQIGAILKSLVRMQDITARMDQDIFMIAFSGHDRASVAPVIKRIEGIVDCAAFESGNSQNGAFTMSLEPVLVEMMPHENSKSLIESALSELTGEPMSDNRISA